MAQIAIAQIIPESNLKPLLLIKLVTLLIQQCYRGKYKTSTLDYGLEYGDSVFGLDSRMYEVTLCFGTLQAFPLHFLIAFSLVPKFRFLCIFFKCICQHLKPRQCIGR